MLPFLRWVKNHCSLDCCLDVYKRQGLALLVLGAVFLWNGCRRKKVSEPKEMVLTACPYCGANVQGREQICQICGENMYVMKNKE